MALIFISIVQLLLILFVLNYAYTKVVWYKKNNRVKDLKEQLNKSAARKYDFINLGSTQGIYAFDYEANGVSGINMSLSPQLFDNDREILEQYAHLIRPDATIIIPVCPLSMLCDKFSIPSNINKYYRLLSKEHFESYNTTVYVKEVLFPLFFQPSNIKDLIKYLIGKLQQSYMPQISEKEFENDALRWIKAWNSEFNVDVSNNISPESLSSRKNRTVQSLSSLVQSASQFGTPIVVLLPVTKYLSSKFNDEFMEHNLYRPLKAAIGSSADIYDYMTDDKLSDPSLYLNSFFLNKKGAAIFTKRFICDIKMTHYGK